MRAAQFEVSRELLRDALHMPSTATIRACWGDYECQVVNFIVEDYSIPEAREPHLCTPILTEQRVSWDWAIAPPPTQEGA